MHNRTYRSANTKTKPKLEIGVRSKIWLVVENGHAFGAGLACLLENVNNYGTLTKAARFAGMSYRYAWNLIRSTEKHLNLELIIPHPGGVGGGHTKLSVHGKKLLETYKQLNREVAQYADSRFFDIFSSNFLPLEKNK